MKRQTVTINTLTYEQLKEYSSKKNVTITTALNQAIMLFLIMEDMDEKRRQRETKST
jgi:hypothetical protein